MPRLHDADARLTRDRRGSIAAIFAVSLIPLVVVVALAVDYSFYIQAKSQFDLAADAASTHAVRIATNAYYQGNQSCGQSGACTVAQSEALGTTAGTEWFSAQLGNIGTASLSNAGLNVAVTYLPSPGGFTATTTYNGTVPTHIGAFITPSWRIGNSSTASAENSYLQIIMLLDNSSSMQIGASYPDILRMMELTACSPISAYDPGNPNAMSTTQQLLNGGTKQYPNGIAPYGAYQCSGGSGSYPSGIVNGVQQNYPNFLSCPINPPPISLPNPPFADISIPAAQPANLFLPAGGAACPRNVALVAGDTTTEPCAFACHFDTSKPAGTGADYYGLARSTIGTANAITLRFDLLKSAVHSLLDSMSAANVGQNLNVGIYSFNTSLTTVYPPATSPASVSFTTAQTDVGLPPSTASTPDTGIQPDTFTLTDPASHADTDFINAMTNLYAQLGPSGDGTSFSSPSKSLFLVTDGYQDYLVNGQPQVSGVDLASCNTFKNNGYTIYVVYTPYYPLMHYWYFLDNQATVEGTGPGTLAYNLQACAGTATQNGFQNTNYYTSASNLSDLTAALNGFLRSALDAATRVAN